ncbi:MAG: radical SAM protein [Planctomycetes bacterium]|nr:radical SAM protein [Planctomycetota bacterium]
MRVTLIYRGRYHVRQATDLETLASVLRQGGHEVGLVYDADAFGVTDNVLQVPWLARRCQKPGRSVRRILDARPDAAVFSVLPSAYPWARTVAAQVKAAQAVPVVFTGLHPSLVPERVMRDACVDYAVQGETENVILPLLEAIAGGREPASVGNLWYRSGGQVCRTPPAEPVNLDALPLPDKDLFRPYVSHRYSYTCMVSRGCPYQCSFCEETCARKVHGPRYFRRKSVDAVMRELAAGKRRYGFREVIFKDSYLSGDRAWLADLMRRYKAQVGVPFKCFCTIRSFDAETARLLKEGGCYNVEFGLQTWNDRLRREVLGRNETSRDALRAFACCADAGLWYDVDHMFNLPTETVQDHIDGAIAYAGLRYLNRVKVHYLVYLPTAEIVDRAVGAGAVPPDIRRLLEDGWQGDFYDSGGGPALRTGGPPGGAASSARGTAGLSGRGKDLCAADYAALYKVLPALSERSVRWLLAGRRVRWLGRIPWPLMAVVQAMLAVRSRDLRFAAYLRMYPAKVLRAVLDR